MLMLGYVCPGGVSGDAEAADDDWNIWVSAIHFGDLDSVLAILAWSGFDYCGHVESELV